MSGPQPHAGVGVIYVDGRPYMQVAPEGGQGATEQECGPKSALGNEFEPKSGRFPHAAHAEILRRPSAPLAYDPHAMAREFPGRWQAYVRANFRNLAHVQQVFSVSERAARKWWNGEGGANGASVAIAMREHPVAAARMLFAAE